MKPGHGPERNGKPVRREHPTDGPFAETKELIGGCASAQAYRCDEAAAVAARNLCLICGCRIDVHPLVDSTAGHHHHSTRTRSTSR